MTTKNFTQIVLLLIFNLLFLLFKEKNNVVRLDIKFSF